MKLTAFFRHRDGRTRRLEVSGGNSYYRISLLYETGEVSDLCGLDLGEAQRWFREQGQALVSIGFEPGDDTPEDPPEETPEDKPADTPEDTPMDDAAGLFDTRAVCLS